MICIHLTCGHVCFDLDTHDDHKDGCERGRVSGAVTFRLFTVSCPYCGAQEGSPCISPTTGATYRFQPHAARRDVYERERTSVSA